jgi:hypothetical protein
MELRVTVKSTKVLSGGMEGGFLSFSATIQWSDSDGSAFLSRAALIGRVHLEVNSSISSTGPPSAERRGNPSRYGYVSLLTGFWPLVRQLLQAIGSRPIEQGIAKRGSRKVIERRCGQLQELYSFDFSHATLERTFPVCLYRQEQPAHPPRQHQEG